MLGALSPRHSVVPLLFDPQVVDKFTIVKFVNARVVLTSEPEDLALKKTTYIKKDIIVWIGGSFYCC